jgi:hypothetical protein
MSITTNNELLTIMKRVGNVTEGYHLHKDDFVGGLYDVTAPKTRVEVWNESHRIDVYIGNDTPMYSTLNSVADSDSDIANMRANARKSKNEICIKVTSLKAFEMLMTYFYSQQYKDSIKVRQSASETAKQSETATKKRTSKKNTSKKRQTA